MMMLSIKNLLNKMLKCCYKQDKSGIWTYRKYADGTAECWGTWSNALTNYSSFAPLYGYRDSQALPSGLFIEAPVITYSANSPNAFAFTGTYLNTTKDTVWVYVGSTGSGQRIMTFYVRCIGKWK